MKYWVWVAARKDIKNDEHITACIHGLRKRKEFDLNDWICGSCTQGNLGPRPYEGDRCPNCGWVVVSTQYIKPKNEHTH